MAFWIVLGLAGLVAGVILYFFGVGVAKGTVSSRNQGLWTGALLALAAVLGGGCALRAAGHDGLAITVLMILVLPGALFGLFALVMIVSNPQR